MSSEGDKHKIATEKRSYKDYQKLVDFVEGKLFLGIKTDDLLNSISLEDDIWSRGSGEFFVRYNGLFVKDLRRLLKIAKKINLEKSKTKKVKSLSRKNLRVASSLKSQRIKIKVVLEFRIFKRSVKHQIFSDMVRIMC